MWFTSNTTFCGAANCGLLTLLVRNESRKGLEMPPSLTLDLPQVCLSSPHFPAVGFPRYRVQIASQSPNGNIWCGFSPTRWLILRFAIQGLIILSFRVGNPNLSYAFLGRWDKSFPLPLGQLSCQGRLLALQYYYKVQNRTVERCLMPPQVKISASPLINRQVASVLNGVKTLRCSNKRRKS